MVLRRYRIHGSLVISYAAFVLAAFAVLFFFLELEGEGEVVVFLLSSTELARCGGFGGCANDA